MDIFLRTKFINIISAVMVMLLIPLFVITNNILKGVIVILMTILLIIEVILIVEYAEVE